MPARLRSKMFYRKELQTGYTQADLLKFEKQANANEVHLRARPAVEMICDTVPTINGVPWRDHPANRMRGFHPLEGGKYFSCPNASVESSDKTKILVGKHA